MANRTKYGLIGDIYDNFILKNYEPIPEWGTLHPRRCPICNLNIGNDFKRGDGLNVKLCSNCDCYYVTPAPDKEELCKLYNSGYMGDRYSISSSDGILKYGYDFKIKTVQSLLKLSDTSVLEVGAGKCELAKVLKGKGADVEVVDLIQEVQNVADILDIKCYIKDFTDFETEKKYDLIIMDDYIEHPLDPFLHICKAVEMLKNGGLLWIWTPNPLYEDGMGKVQFMLNFEHMQYLSHKTLWHVAKTLGISIIHLESIGYPYHYSMKGDDRTGNFVTFCLFLK